MCQYVDDGSSARSLLSLAGAAAAMITFSVGEQARPEEEKRDTKDIYYDGTWRVPNRALLE